MPMGGGVGNYPAFVGPEISRPRMRINPGQGDRPVLLLHSCTMVGVPLSEIKEALRTIAKVPAA